MIDRRRFVKAGGGLAALLPFVPFAGHAGETVEIAMTGRDQGAHVWFDPAGIRIEPGQTVRWTNRDPGNSHTATSYHPDLYGRPLRMPKAAAPFDSDLLLPGESFSVRLSVPGVYDYYCIPHEHAGMVGRIVVGSPGGESRPDAADGGDLPEIALAAFPPVGEIMAKGTVRRK